MNENNQKLLRHQNSLASGKGKNRLYLTDRYKHNESQIDLWFDLILIIGN